MVRDPAAQERLARVRRLIDGFETPYGLELLATVHWVSREMQEAAGDVELAIEQVQRWNSRKQERYRPLHIERAWRRLRDEQWMGLGG